MASIHPSAPVSASVGEARTSDNTAHTLHGSVEKTMEVRQARCDMHTIRCNGTASNEQEKKRKKKENRDSFGSLPQLQSFW
jgi:hypothetical protein